VCGSGNSRAIVHIPCGDVTFLEMRRLAALDGFRGVAVALVLAHHLLGLRQGWIGVDFFFVLSGYLITTILLSERDHPDFWSMFYIRRLTRILPAFLLLLAASTASGLLPWRTLWPYLVFFASNLGFVQHDQLMFSAGLSVLWSLAVEEHFYFVWPAQVRRFERKTLVWTLFAIVLLDPVARVLLWGYKVDWKVAYTLTPFRIDGLAIGALLALAFAQETTRTRIKHIAPWALPLCLAATVLCWPLFLDKEHVLFCSSIGYTLLAVTASALTAHLVLFPVSLYAKILAWRPLVFLGRISYGLYLCHILISLICVSFANRHGYMHNERVMVMTIPVSIFAAWLSFRFYESRFLAWGKRRVHGFSEQRAVVSRSFESGR
jgi:peptidoglycan/LPS O-acetylase OafA/YrhL